MLKDKLGTKKDWFLPVFLHYYKLNIYLSSSAITFKLMVAETLGAILISAPY